MYKEYTINAVQYSRNNKLPYSQLFWRALKLANWSLTCLAEINFGDLVKPIHQIKIPAKVSGYTVLWIHVERPPHT